MRGGVLRSSTLRRRRFLIITLICTLILSHYVHASLPENGLRLAIYIAPPVVPADGGEYKCIYVQIQDAEGKPVKAFSEVEVILTSSNLEVGAVEEAVKIPEGCEFTVAKFTTSLFPGETTITASSFGFETGRAVLKTASKRFSSLPPYRLKVTVAPRVLPAVKGFKGIVSVQIVDRFNTPIEASSDTRVVLASSNLSVLEVVEALVIPRGSSYTVAFFNVKEAAGSASLTALAQGFEPGNVTVDAVKTGGEPARLVLTPIIPILPSDGGIHEYAVVVGLLDANGVPTAAREDVKVMVASSNPDVIAVPDAVTIRRGYFYATIPVRTGFEEGGAVLAVSSQGLKADAVMLNVKRCIGLSLRPFKLAVYMALPVVIADGESKEIVVVQIQDDGGMPTALTCNTTVYLTYSANIGSIPPRIVIEPGETYAVASFTPFRPGVTNITALAQGLESSTVGLTAILLPVDVTVEAPSKVEVNQTYTVKLSATSLGFPLSNATVDWTVTGGEVVSEVNLTDSSGEANLTVKQTKNILTVLVRVSKPGYEMTTSTIRVEAVSPPLVSKPLEVELFGFKVPVLQLIVTIACIVASLTIVYWYIKRMESRRASQRRNLKS